MNEIITVIVSTLQFDPQTACEQVVIGDIQKCLTAGQMVNIIQQEIDRNIRLKKSGHFEDADTQCICQ